MINRLMNFITFHIKTFGGFHGIRKILITSIYKRLTDEVMADHVFAKSSFFYIRNFYRKKKNIEFNLSKPENDTVNNIKDNELIYWTCWLQGIENAPDLVKSCFKSAERISKGCRIIVITYDNFKTYTALPDFILDKHKKGYIPAPQFTDIIRIYLLYTYGGVWFDSTVFFTKQIPEELLKEKLFFFRSPLDDKYCPVSNWFIIASKENNYVLYKLLCILLEYWRINNKCIDYFIFHYFLQIIINYNTKIAEEFNKIPYYCNQNPHFLQLKYLFSDFDNELWNIIENISFCHKLTYKIPAGKEKRKENTFFSFLINLYKDNYENNISRS